MKTPLQPGLSTPVLAAALLIIPLCPAISAEPAPYDNDPKIGSRIVNFFRGLVQRDAPPEYPQQQQQQQPRRTYPRQPGPRYSLDTPPPIPQGYGRDESNEPPAPRRTYPEPEQGHQPAAPETGRQDLPYETPRETEAPRQRPPENTRPRQENAPPTSKSPTPAPAPPTKISKPKTPEPSKLESGRSPVSAPDPKPEPESTPPPPRREEPAPNLTTTNKPASETGTGTGTASPAGSPQVGSKTAKPGRVKSPYPPYNELDVTGLSSGSLAMDPTTQKVFRVP